MVEDTSINEVEVREDNLIGTHEERVNEALLVVDTLELPDECSLGSRMPGFIGQILLKPRIYTSSIYSCFLSHILEREFCYLVCWAAKGSKGKFLKRRNFCLPSSRNFNMIIPSIIKIFNFLWLIWDPYLPLAPT